MVSSESDKIELGSKYEAASVYAQEKGYDWVLAIEDDVCVPIDCAERLLQVTEARRKQNADVGGIVGVCAERAPGEKILLGSTNMIAPFHVPFTAFGPQAFHPLTPEEATQPYVEVNTASMPFLFWPRILKQESIHFHGHLGFDWHFCVETHAKAVKILCVPSVVADHVF